MITTSGTSSQGVSRRVLSKEGIDCSIVALGPGEQISLSGAPTQEHLVFVIEGEVRVVMEGITSIVEKDRALHISDGREHLITDQSGRWSKLLRVDFTPRETLQSDLCVLPSNRSQYAQ